MNTKGQAGLDIAMQSKTNSLCPGTLQSQQEACGVLPEMAIPRHRATSAEFFQSLQNQVSSPKETLSASNKDILVYLSHVFFV